MTKRQAFQWFLVGVAVTVYHSTAQGGPSARVVVVDDGGNRVHGASVLLQGSDKQTLGVQVSKGEWFFKSVGNKAKLLVRNADRGGSTEISIPESAGEHVEVILHLEGGGVRAEVVSARTKTRNVSPFDRISMGDSGHQQVQGCLPDFSLTAPLTFNGDTCGAGNDCILRTSDEHIIAVTLPNDGLWTFSLCGSSFDTFLYLGTNCCGSEVDFDDDGCGTPSSEVTTNLTAGTYYVAVEAFGSGGCGSYTLDVSKQPPPQGCEGDTCASPISIPSVPFSDTRNTCSCVDNYDETCPFDAPGSPELVYRYMPSADECVNITLCNGSAYDTKLYVYENSCGAYQSGVFHACNDDGDGCSGFTSKLENVQLTGGNPYYIVVDGYDGGCGDYVIDITPCGAACDVVCDAAATPEGEPVCADNYNDTTNGGCNSNPPVFSPITCGATVCSEAGTFLGEFPCTTDDECPFPESCVLGICTGGPYEFRDTDWYKLTIASDQEVTWTVEAEFPVLFGIVDTGGVDSCVGVTSFLVAATADDCTPGSVTACLSPGTWYLLVAPADFTGVICGADYEASVSCAPCPTGACCLPSGVCQSDITEPGCAGTWQGQGTTCGPPNPCPQPPPNDLCEDAVLVAIPSMTSGSTQLATIDSGFPTPCGDATITSPGVWYSLVGNGNMITASLCNAATGFDSKISVFCDDCIEPACVDGNDDFCGLQSQVTWCSEAGRTYYILVHSFGGQTGPFQLDVSQGAPCADPPSCEPLVICPGPGDCCVSNPGTVGCNDSSCCEMVCALDPYCCGLDPVFGGEWDQLCADVATANCAVCAPTAPTGACCIGQSCEIRNETECAAAGGTYLGDNTSCLTSAGNPQAFVTNPNAAIPDGGGPLNPAVSAINVPNSFTMGDINVDLVVTHTWVGDLTVTLEHNGTTVTLIDRPGVPASPFGCPSNDYNIILDDQGTGGSIEALCGPDDALPTPTSPPNYLSNEALSAFVGMDSAGAWTLTVFDSATPDPGSLVAWSLHLDGTGPSPCIPRGACCTSSTVCTATTAAQCAAAGGVYVGDGSACFAPGPVTMYNASPGTVIPDGGGPADAASHTITVTDSYTMMDVDVDFQTDHTWVGDLIISVEHNGTTVVVVDRPGIPPSAFGCNTDGYDIILDDEGTGGPIDENCVSDPGDVLPTPTSPPNYTPNNPLSAFDGMDSAGDWTITVSDNAGFDSGSLQEWSLHLQATGPSPCADLFGACCDGETGLCLNIGAAACVGTQREYFTGQTCAELSPPCEQHRGACCNTGTGVCTPDVLPGDCAGVGQVWSKEQNCAQVTCAADMGACCDQDTFGGCQQTTSVGCACPKCTWYSLQDCGEIECVHNPIPTVSQWGLVVLTLLLLTGAKVYFGRRQSDVLST